MSGVKGIIFDLDGVIVHTDKLHYLGWKRLADGLNIYFDEEINNRCRGVSRMESLNIVLEKSGEHYTEAQKKVFAEQKNNYYRELLATMTPSDVTADVRETLVALRYAGYLLAIGSSSKNAKTILSRVGLTEMFHAISDGENITHSKPHPEVFLKAAEFLNLKPHECIVVEDALAGIEAGKAAGMKTIAIGDAAGAGTSNMDINVIPDILSAIKQFLCLLDRVLKI